MATIKPQAAIKIHSVAAPKLPAIDEAFAKQLGIEEGTVEALREQVRTHMEQELNNVLRNKLKEKAIDKLIEKNPVELPKALVEMEQEHIQKEWLTKMQKGQGMQAAQLPTEAIEKSLEVARQRVSLSILFSEVIKKYDIKLDEAKVRTHVERIASSFQGAPDMINMIYKHADIMNGVCSHVMEELVVDKLLEQVQYTEKAESYADVMQFGSSGMGRMPVHNRHHHDHHDHEHCDHDHHHHEHCDHDHDHSHADKK